MSSVHQILPPGSLLAVWTSHVSLRVVHSCDQGRLLPTLSPTMGSLQTRTEDTTDPVGLTELICSKLKDEVPNVPTLWSQQKHQIKKKQRNCPGIIPISTSLRSIVRRCHCLFLGFGNLRTLQLSAILMVWVYDLWGSNGRLPATTFARPQVIHSLRVKHHRLE